MSERASNFFDPPDHSSELGPSDGHFSGAESEIAVTEIRHQIESGELGIDGPSMPVAGTFASYADVLMAAKRESARHWRPDWRTVLADAQTRFYCGNTTSKNCHELVRYLLKQSARADFITRALNRGVPATVAKAVSGLIWLTEPGMELD